ncbi:MAG: hypothetical protein JWN86_974 [Planctomycetota bacterium]|nr:hypothetical protein [Planctomycetota bacterium]
MDGKIDIPDRAEETKEGEPARKAVVVVQYRRTWIATISTPLLILIAAGAVLSHRVKMDDWRGLAAYFSAQDASAPPVRVEREAPIAPIVLAVPDRVVSGDAPLGAVSRPPDPPKPRIGPPMPMAASVRPIAPTDSKAQAARVWDDIRQEAARTQVQTVAMEAVKAREGAEVERLAPLVEQERLAQVRNESEADRISFLKDLRKAVGAPAGRAGQAIKDLCDRHGVWLGPEPKHSTADRISGLTFSGRREHVESMRSKGVTEAMILDDLVRVETRNRVARSGPKTEEEILIRAARNLLAVPPSKKPQPRETR